MKLFLGQISGAFSAHSGVMFTAGRNITGVICFTIGILLAILGGFCDD